MQTAVPELMDTHGEGPATRKLYGLDSTYAPTRIFDIAPLLQPLFEGLILLAAVSIAALGVLRVRNTLELFR